MARSKKTKPMLTKRWLVNYLLIFLVICLTWVANRFPVEDFDKPSNAITTLKAESIDHIKVETADRVLRLALNAGQWQFTSPISWPANNIAVERLLGITRMTTESRLAASQIELSELGLSIPQAVLRLNDTDILFGDTNNIGNRRYLKIGGMVFLVEDRHLPFINQGLTGLIDRRLLPPVFEIDQLKLSRDTLTREQGSWRSAQREEISSDRVNSLISQWQSLQARRVAAYRATDVPLHKVIASSNGQTLEFFVLKIEPEIVIARPDLGLQYHFTKSQYYDLLTLDEQPS